MLFTKTQIKTLKLFCSTITKSYSIRAISRSVKQSYPLTYHSTKDLIKKGISRERLVAKGYGETNPIAQNENHDGSDNPDGRAKNRRTEFKILGSLKEKYSKVIYDF